MEFMAKVKPETMEKAIKDSLKIDAFDAMVKAYKADGRYYQKMDSILLILEAASHLVDCVGKDK